MWFRLLRSLLDELGLALTTMNQSARRTLEQVWDTAGLRARAGISVWRSHEHLPWDTQEKLSTAAAVAVTLVAERQIVARGTFGSLLASTPHEPVYAGDAPYGQPTVSTDFARPACDFAVAMEEWLRAARPQPGPAGQMLQMLTWYSTTPEKIISKREYLIRQGIPPESRHLDPQPLWGRSVTANEAAVILVREGFEPAEDRQAVGAFLVEVRPGSEFGDERANPVERGCITEDDLGQLRARLSL